MCQFQVRRIREGLPVLPLNNGMGSYNKHRLRLKLRNRSYHFCKVFFITINITIFWHLVSFIGKVMTFNVYKTLMDLFILDLTDSKQVIFFFQNIQLSYSNPAMPLQLNKRFASMSECYISIQFHLKYPLLLKSKKK
jgi:hypothetical protein